MLHEACMKWLKDRADIKQYAMRWTREADYGSSKGELWGLDESQWTLHPEIPVSCVFHTSEYNIKRTEVKM